MPDTRPSPDEYILCSELKLSGWGPYASSKWQDMTEKKDHWKSFLEDGLDLFFPPVAESADRAQFRKQLVKLVCSDLHGRHVPHPLAWMLASKHLTRSSCWTMRVLSKPLLDKKEAIIKKRMALLQRLAPAFAVPRTAEEIRRDLSVPATKHFLTYRELPRDIPALLRSRLHAVGDDAAQAAVRQEWHRVWYDEMVINRDMEKTAPPLVRVHAQMVEVDGPPPVPYAEADLAAMRALAQKYARMFEGGGEEAVMHHAYAMVHRAVGKIDSFTEAHGCYGQAAKETQALDQVAAYKLLTRSRRPKVMMLRVYMHRQAQSRFIANDKHRWWSSARYPALTALTKKQEELNRLHNGDKHREYIRLLETLRGPRCLTLRDECDQNNKTPAHVLSDAVVHPSRSAVAARGALPHQHKVLDRMKRLESDSAVYLVVQAPSSPGNEDYKYVFGIPRVPGTVLARTQGGGGGGQEGEAGAAPGAVPPPGRRGDAGRGAGQDDRDAAAHGAPETPTRKALSGAVPRRRGPHLDPGGATPPPVGPLHGRPTCKCAEWTQGGRHYRAGRGGVSLREAYAVVHQRHLP